MTGRVSMYDAIDSHVQKGKESLWTSTPAIVDSYNSETQTINAKLALHITTNLEQPLDSPLLQDIPVIFPSAGGGILSFPIQKGDNVLLVFAKNSLDKWKVGKGDKVVLDSKRSHNLSDAIAIIGLTTTQNTLSLNPEDVELKYTDNSITLKTDGSIDVMVKDKLAVNNSTDELISVLSDALQAVADITTNTAYGVSPINNKPDVLAIKARLDTFKK